MNNILIVEDDEFFTMALRGLLESEGFHVLSAENGKAAIKILEKSRIDCVVSDLQMPGMGGVELAKWVVANRKIPIIMMTGYVETINTLTAVELGAINILYKPFSDEDIVKAVREALSTPISPGKIAFDGFTRISQSVLIANSAAEFNLYRLIDDRLQKIVSKGEPFYLKDLNQQNISHVYTENENLEKVVHANLMIVRAISKSSTVNSIKKTDMIQKSLELLHSRLAVSGKNSVTRDEALDLASSYLHMIERAHVWEILNRFHGAGHNPYAAQLAATALAVLLARARSHPQDFQSKIVAAGFFPDFDFNFASLPEQTAEIARLLGLANEFFKMIQRESGGMRPAQALATIEANPDFDRSLVATLKQMMSAEPTKGNQSA